MNTERSLPRYLLPAALVLFLICGFASMPIAAAESVDSSTDSFCVELDGDIGHFQRLWSDGVCIIDCDGNQFSLTGFLGSINEDEKIIVDLSGSGLNLDKPFKEVKLHLTLIREWGFIGIYIRYDKFTLDVTDLVTKKKGKPYTVQLKADNSYQVGKADAVTFYDQNGNKLKHFSSTADKEGHYGSWDDSLTNKFCVDMTGYIGLCSGLRFNGVCITDCNGNQFVLNSTTILNDGDVAKIDLLGSGLNCNKPFKEVKLHLTLIRYWGFLCITCDRYDKFTLDVTDLVTKKKGKSHYSVLLEVHNSYQVGKADAVTFYDQNGNKLKHFSSTDKEGHYGSWDV